MTSDGEVVDCRVNSFVEKSRDVDFIRTVAIYNETSDQAREDSKYRQLYRATPAMLHTVDADGCIVTATDHWLQKMEYSREEVVGRSVQDFYSESDLQKFSDGQLQKLSGLGAFNNEPRQMVTRSGKVLDLLMSAIPEYESTGEVRRMLVASKDVTERNRAERALRDALAENARLQKELERERDYLREEVNVAMNFGRIIGKSASLRQMLMQIEAVANTPATVLILGESGVGKELVARAIHAESKRAQKPFIAVNVANFSSDLIESQLFGHKKGAFTGAVADSKGFIRAAAQGTLFLDEVTCLSPKTQAKLLRVLQERQFYPVGDVKLQKFSASIVSYFHI